MKYIILLSLIIISCKDQKPLSMTDGVKTERIPRAVHDTCTDSWAIVTRERYNGDNKVIMNFFGKSYNVYVIKHLDSSDYAELGKEYQYNDSLVAITSYLKYKKEQKEIEDNQLRMQVEKQRVADSIFKCQHTYQ